MLDIDSLEVRILYHVFVSFTVIFYLFLKEEMISLAC